MDNQSLIVEINSALHGAGHPIDDSGEVAVVAGHRLMDTDEEW